MTTPPAGSGGSPARATNVCVVLLDSLNRHLLGSYGGTEFATPNLDRFARERATRFTRHVTGSLPCMPARHDILVGALDFLWKPWGSIELWEQPITRVLGASGVTSMLVTDHPHLFETGGENFHVDFSGWDYVRGHEGDPWRTHPDPSWIGTPTLPARERRLVLRAHARRRPHQARLRPVADVLPRRGGLPRTARDARGGALPHRRHAVPRPVVPLRRRVRPARAVRHARRRGSAATTTSRGPTTCSSGRRTPTARSCATSSPNARAGTSAGTTAASSR